MRFLLVLILTILSLSTFTLGRPADDDQSDKKCIVRTPEVEKQLSSFVEKMIKYLQQLTVEHEQFDVRFIRLDLDRHSEDEKEDEEETIFEVHVNDCADKTKPAPKKTKAKKPHSKNQKKKPGRKLESVNPSPDINITNPSPNSNISSPGPNNNPINLIPDNNTVKPISNNNIANPSPNSNIPSPSPNNNNINLIPDNNTVKPIPNNNIANPSPNSKEDDAPCTSTKDTPRVVRVDINEDLYETLHRTGKDHKPILVYYKGTDEEIFKPVKGNSGIQVHSLNRDEGLETVIDNVNKRDGKPVALYVEQEAGQTAYVFLRP